MKSAPASIFSFRYTNSFSSWDSDEVGATPLSSVYRGVGNGVEYGWPSKIMHMRGDCWCTVCMNIYMYECICAHVCT